MENNISTQLLEEILVELKQNSPNSPVGFDGSINDEIRSISGEALLKICSFVAARVLADSYLRHDYIRVFRIVEHYGPRADVQRQLQSSLFGTRRAVGKSYVTAYPLETMDEFSKEKET